MAIVQILGDAELPNSGSDGTLVAQPALPLESITSNYPMMNAVDPGSTVGAGKYVGGYRTSDPCARLAYLQGKGIKLTPERATAMTTACSQARGIAPTQPNRYQTSTGDSAAIDPTTGESVETNTGYSTDPSTGYITDLATGVTTDPTTGNTVDPATGLPVEPWYMNKTYWLIGGAALVGIWLIAK
jgi:hypothetical protein